eukprot:m.12476 g.12476  ORF g.12476 m.12476 type:complete len:261 (+) comp4658_c0_seq1:168-950(+)
MSLFRLLFSFLSVVICQGEETALSIRQDFSNTDELLPGSQFGEKLRLFDFSTTESEIEPVEVFQSWDEGGLACVVWEAAVILAEHLAKSKRSWSKVRVLELGAGPALLSLCTGRLGALITVATDRPGHIECARDNIARNNLVDKVQVEPLDWTSDLQIHKIIAKYPDGWDLCIGSDLVYMETMFQPLLQTIEMVCGGLNTNTTILIAGKKRYRERFRKFRKLASSKFDITVHRKRDSHYILEMKPLDHNLLNNHQHAEEF